MCIPYLPSGRTGRSLEIWPSSSLVASQRLHGNILSAEDSVFTVTWEQCHAVPVLSCRMRSRERVPRSTQDSSKVSTCIKSVTNLMTLLQKLVTQQQETGQFSSWKFVKTETLTCARSNLFILSLFLRALSPESPFSPYTVRNTLESVPAPVRSDVDTATE